VIDFIAELKRRNVLRVGAAYLLASWLILQFVDVVFPMLGLDEALGRPILIVLAIGFPAVLIFAWAFEMTAQGLKQEKHVDRSESATTRTGRRLDRAITIVLIFAVGLLLVDKFVLQNEAPPEVISAGNLDSVAVLPFVNLSGAAENEYFSDGLTETLLHMLAQVPDLKVAARTSAFAFKGRDEDIRQIADALNVATVLEGSVQRSGNKVRITAQLIEAQTGFHLWSQTFDRDLDDIFLVQDEIATSVVGALQATLLGVPAAQPVQMAGVGTTNMDAYEKYLLGLEQKNIASYSSLPQAEGLFKQALTIDPGFVEAKMELAHTYKEQADTGLITREESVSRTRPLLEQVIAQNPRHGRALGQLAAAEWIEAVRTSGFDRAGVQETADRIEAAIELAPNEPDLYLMMAAIARVFQDDEESLTWLDEGLARDPLSADLHWQKGNHLLGQMDDPARAEVSFARARELAPEWTAVYSASANAARFRGEFADSLRWDMRAMELDPQDHELPARIGRFYYQLGLVDEGDEMLARAQILAPQAPWTRSLEIERQMHAENYERAILLAESMIRDDIDDRGGAWENALAAFVESKIELDDAADVPVFFESVIPGITSPVFEVREFKHQIMQFFLTIALVDIGAYDQANAIFDPLVEWFETNVPGFQDNHSAMMNIALFRGDTETAVEQALLDLEGPLGRNMGWRAPYETLSWLAPVTKDARLASRLAELNAQTLVAAEEVRDFLAGRDGQL